MAKTLFFIFVGTVAELRDAVDDYEMDKAYAEYKDLPNYEGRQNLEPDNPEEWVE